MGSLKIFLKYIFSPTGFLEGLVDGFRKLFEPKRFATLMILFGVYFLIKFPKPRNAYYAIFCFVVALVLQLRVVYISGEHIGWNREKIGIINSKKIKKEAI